MKKCKIDCPVHTDEGREWEVTADGRVWPCCYFANGWDKRSHEDGKNDDTQTLKSDTVLQQVMNQDFEWNSLNTYSLEEIVDHEIYWTHIWKPGWDSDNPPTMCVKECSVEVDEITGVEIGGSDLRVGKYLNQ